MIDEVDTALQGLLTGETLAGTDIQVAFDAPTKDWAARRTAPTVNLFLYDIQEDTELRQHGTMAEYDAEGVLVAEHEPPRYFALSYLVTAWTNRAQDEHRILSILLAGLVRHDAVPPDRLGGTLASMEIPVRLSVAMPPARDRGLADIWTAVGGNLKPSLDLVVLAPLAASVIRAGAVVTDGMRLRLHDNDSPADETRRLRIAGAAADPAAPLGAERERELPTARRRRGGPLR
ncbi:DUF4255 domain-containing protein [Symbioplanes lichenis]|uniref:DUF4255 domain-containing protein n=1 Tax=Symbioplanes lichenis TaxID=1629072 RepID=UPI00273974D6|nr:DUF4255 domain-containing protein [Actinoplanes lichenis]